MNLIDPEEITFVTFATFGQERGQRDYSDLVLKLRETCDSLGVRLLVASFLGSGVKEVDFEVQRMLPMRKGAGYWSWKPDVISMAMENIKSRYLIYIDCDLNLKSRPKIFKTDDFEYSGIAAFETVEKLSDWSSKRCLREFGLGQDVVSKIISASLIVVDTDNQTAKKVILNWTEKIQNLELLLDPFWTLKNNHRHDQSIFSCLVASGEVTIQKMTFGFFQTGLENSTNLVDAWVVHGDVKSETEFMTIRKISLIRSYLFHKLELFYFLLIYKARKLFSDFMQVD